MRETKLYALVLTILGEFDKAECRWKYICLRNPGLKTLYSFYSFLHEKAQKYFQKNTSNLGKMKVMLNELSHCL